MSTNEIGSIGRAEAERMLTIVQVAATAANKAGADISDYLNPAAVGVGSIATAHALLALVEQVARIAEQLRVANVISAFGTATEESLIDVADEADAEIYVRGAIHRILNQHRHTAEGENH